MNEQNTNNEKQPEYMIKLLVLGDLSVGKSSFIYRFIYDKFSPGEMQTSELELKTGDIIVNKKNVRVQLWDTVGQEKYKSITKNLILRVQGIILMFDLSNKETYKNYGGYWLALAESYFENRNYKECIICNIWI